MYDEFCTIHQLLAQDLTVGEAMQRLLDAWAEDDPDTDYAPFYELPYDEEAERLATEWFEPLVKRSPPAATALASLWFVLEEIEGEGDDFCDKTGDFHLAGSSEFTIDKQTDWQTRVTYGPEGHVAGARVISAFYRTMLEEQECYGDGFEYMMCTGYVAFAVKRLLRDVDPRQITSGDHEVQVIVGYDRGDAIYPGKVTHSGFVLRDLAEVEALYNRSREESDREFEQAVRATTSGIRWPSEG